VKLAAALSILVIGLAQALPTRAHARDLDAGPADYRALMKLLGPGDTLRLAPGTYRDGLPIHRMSGRPGAPIRIEARDRNARPRLLARARHNTISIVDSSFIEVAGLDLDGTGLSVDAVKAEGHARFAHDITIEDLLIRGHGADQQDVGISTQCPAWNWVIRGNVILGAGTGIYLGGSDGGAPFVAGVIERNLIRDTRGYNLQIKHQERRPSLPGMPAGRSVTIIRHNVFSKAENGSTAELARPNVLVGHFPPSGPGAEDQYLVYGNFFYQNPTEALFQGEGNVALYSNIFLSTFGSAINIQPHNGRPESIDVFGNTIVARDSGIRVVNGDPTRTQRAFGNAVFAETPIQSAQATANVIGSFAEAVRLLQNPFAPLGELDLTARSADALRVGQWPDVPSGMVAAGEDFEGRRRTGEMAGAYNSIMTWRPVLQRKPSGKLPSTRFRPGN